MKRLWLLSWKEMRGQWQVLVALWATLSWGVWLTILMCLQDGDWRPMRFFVAGLDFETTLLGLTLPAIVCFWGGLRAFSVEWRDRTMIWLKTMPVRDGTVGGVKLATGVIVILAAIVLTFIVQQSLWLAFGGSFSGLDMRLYRIFTIKTFVILTLMLTPFYLAGSLVSALTRRMWLALVVGAVAWFGLIFAGVMILGVAAATAVIPEDQVLTLLRPQVAYPALTQLLYLVACAVLAALSLRAHRLYPLRGWR